MRSVYPVFFTKAKNCVLVEVPDLEILTEGKDMSDAIEMARDAIELNCVFCITYFFTLVNECSSRKCIFC